MQSSNRPANFPIPFAYSAGSAYIRPIPTPSQISITPGAASLTDGFPPANFVGLSGGGVYPSGDDFNGLFKWITQVEQYLQAGGCPVYNSEFSTAIGGYPKGSILLAASQVDFWVSTTENNTTNPDAAGAGWVKLIGPAVAAALATAEAFATTAANNALAAANIHTDASPGTSSNIFTTGGGGSSGTENDLVVKCNGYDPAYLYNRGSAWGLFSTSGGDLIRYDRATETAQVAGTLVAPYFQGDISGCIGGYVGQKTIAHPSRSAGVIYTNTTGKTMAVSVSYSAPGGTPSNLAGYVNSSLFDETALDSTGTATAATLKLTLIVPPGYTYEVIQTGGTLINWAEAY